MDYSLEATYYRTALLLGLIDGVIAQRWAEQVIASDPEPPPAFFEIVSVPAGDLSALRYVLWPLATEPEPLPVLRAMFGLLHTDLESSRRGLRDTLTILRQMRSMLRLPPAVYAELNAALVAHAATSGQEAGIARWLQQFAQSGLPPLRRNER